MTTREAATTSAKAPSRTPGLLLGLGFGGFVDGIVLHQILQWHHMLSGHGHEPMDTVLGLELNTLADGFFHLATWVLVFLGTVLMLASWRRGQLAPSWRFHFGLLIAGWGIFDVVEGLIDHQILGVHHVRDDLGGPLAWDIGFLAFGVVLIAIGFLMYRSGSKSVGTTRPSMREPTDTA